MENSFEKLNETLNVIFNRISLRKYDKKSISDEDLNLILDATIRAPTAGNNMLYSIILIKDKETKEKLAVSCDNQPFIKEADVIMVFLADVKRLYDYFKLCNVKEFCLKNNLKYNEPNMQMLYLGLNDALIAAQTAVIAAESLGIGSCYIGDIAERFEYHKELLNLPENVFIATMLCFGYYPEGYEKKLRPRFDKKYIVHKEKYNIINSDQLKKMYELYAERFNQASSEADKGLKYDNYGQFLYAKKFGSDFSLEMERSIKKMLENWG
ncbi:MAG: nitroreductase family protein [Spirochaetota bacterium]